MSGMAPWSEHSPTLCGGATTSSSSYACSYTATSTGPAPSLQPAVAHKALPPHSLRLLFSPLAHIWLPPQSARASSAFSCSRNAAAALSAWVPSVCHVLEFSSSRLHLGSSCRVTCSAASAPALKLFLPCRTYHARTQHCAVLACSAVSRSAVDFAAVNHVCQHQHHSGHAHALPPAVYPQVKQPLPPCQVLLPAAVCSQRVAVSRCSARWFFCRRSSQMRRYLLALMFLLAVTRTTPPICGAIHTFRVRLCGAQSTSELM
jgi:hypothetical protein